MTDDHARHVRQQGEDRVALGLIDAQQGTARRQGIAGDGQQRLLEIALALATRPKVLLRWAARRISQPVRAMRSR